jgi:hypothetical protein
MSEWKPIETAPRDGSWFVICRVGDDPERYEVGCYNPLCHFNYVEVENGLFRREKERGYEWSGFSNFHRATHWMPLPAPPSP